MVLLGEQPGDVEDRRGEPFVGPAGKLLRRALDEAEIAESGTCLTNVVKHFRWREDPRGGKRRIHQRPDAAQIAACRPWWQAEVRLLRPTALVALGATAGEALFGRSFRVGAARGTVVAWPVPPEWETTAQEENGQGQAAGEIRVVPTIHPSAVLRDPNRDEAFDGLVADLRSVAELLAEHGRPARRAARS